MTITAYPDGVDVTGPTIARLVDQPIQFKAAVFQNEDGGCDVNVQPCGWREWVLEYEGLSAADLATLRSHFNEAQGKVNDFSFYHRRDFVTYAGVKYVSWRIGQHPKIWANVVTVTLGKYI